jgi:FtsZ-interacting cell division protein ZipA
MKLLETKYMVGVVIVICLLVLYIWWKTKKTERATAGVAKKKATRSKMKPRKSKSARARPTEAVRSNETEEPDDEDQDSAQELYNLVHDRMSSGMQSDEFIEAVGDDYDNLTYIEIKQLYNDAKNRGQDPSEVVTIDEYASVLNKRSMSE